MDQGTLDVSFEVPTNMDMSYERFINLEFREGLWAGDIRMGLTSL